MAPICPTAKSRSPWPRRARFRAWDGDIAEPSQRVALTRCLLATPAPRAMAAVICLPNSHLGLGAHRFGRTGGSSASCGISSASPRQCRPCGSCARWAEQTWPRRSSPAAVSSSGPSALAWASAPVRTAGPIATAKRCATSASCWPSTDACQRPTPCADSAMRVLPPMFSSAVARAASARLCATSCFRTQTARPIALDAAAGRSMVRPCPGRAAARPGPTQRRPTHRPIRAQRRHLQDRFRSGAVLDPSSSQSHLRPKPHPKPGPKPNRS